MSRRRRAPHMTALIAAGTILSVVSACGSSGDEGGIPSELVGTYTATLEESDILGKRPRELVDGGPKWKLTFTNSGGPDDGPVLVIDSERAGNLEAPSLRVEGDRLQLEDEECAAGGSYVFYDNEYRWALDGSSLTIMPIVNQCEDEVAQTILTSRPWTKTG